MKSLIALTSTLFFPLFIFASVPTLEQKDFSSLLKAAKNQSLPMTERWQSLTKAGEIAKPEQIDELKTFSKSSDWFMRNAALVALESISLDEASDQARILIQDKALVVRSAAVSTLAKKMTRETKQIFASELEKSYNYSGHQSLWIRPQMMQHLVKSVSVDDRHFLVRYLFDSDKKVAILSANALEKITDVRFDEKNQIMKWQAYVKSNGWL